MEIVFCTQKKEEKSKIEVKTIQHSDIIFDLKKIQINLAENDRKLQCEVRKKEGSIDYRIERLPYPGSEIHEAPELWVAQTFLNVAEGLYWIRFLKIVTKKVPVKKLLGMRILEMNEFEHQNLSVQHKYKLIMMSSLILIDLPAPTECSRDFMSKRQLVFFQEENGLSLGNYIEDKFRLQ